MQTDEGRIFLALDGAKSPGEALSTIWDVMQGPIQPYLAGIKLNDALHGLGDRSL